MLPQNLAFAQDLALLMQRHKKVAFVGTFFQQVGDNIEGLTTHIVTPFLDETLFLKLQDELVQLVNSTFNTCTAGTEQGFIVDPGLSTDLKH